MTYHVGDIVENTRLKVMDDVVTKRIVGFIHGCTVANIGAAKIRELLWNHYDVIIFVEDIEEEQQALQDIQQDDVPMESYVAGFIEAWALYPASDHSVQRVAKLLYGYDIPIPVIHQMRQTFLDKPKSLHGC